MKLRYAARLLAFALLATFSPAAFGYYYWTYYSSRTAPFTPAPAKFDLNALPGKTVLYFLGPDQPTTYVQGDSYLKLVSQIRAAAAVWDGVATSDLRVKFGGIQTGTTTQATPGIDIVFDDNLPPGVLALTRPSISDDLSGVANGQSFVALQRSRIQFRRDLTVKRQASWNEDFFITMVHEFGHALGLQHTTTSSVMSTGDIQRAATKARPLAADDVAGISNLYPAAGFPESTGSISGRLLAAGAGVSMGSVVAISPTGVAVGTYTNPDGTYRIAGLAPGQYLVYAQPLPPTPMDIVAPVDTRYAAFTSTGAFAAQFYPGTRDFAQATPVMVTAANTADNVNFNTQRVNTPAVYNMATFAYQGAGGQVPVAAPSLVAGSRNSVVFYAPGTLAPNNTQPAAGLNVSVLAGPAQVESGSVRFYTQGYLLMTVAAANVAAPTPVTLSVSVNNDVYVLPAAFTVVPAAPPQISSVSGTTDAFGNASVSITGANLSADDRLLFDGAPAIAVQANADGSLTAVAPPALGNHVASIVALSPDGQSSSQALGTAAPATFTYAAPDNPSLTVTPQSLTPGTDSMVEISGVNTAFLDGHVSVGFGSSDITVRRVWVTGRGRILVNLSVGASAQPFPVPVTVASGLQLATLNSVVQILPANPRRMTMQAPVLNQVTGLAGVPAGGSAVVITSGLPQTFAGWTVTVNDIKTSGLLASNAQLYFQVPAGLPPGPAIIRVTSPTGDQIPAVVMQIDAPPPVISAATSAGNSAIDGAHPVRPGDDVIFTVSSLADSGTGLPSQPVRVVVAGVEHVPTSINPSSQPGVYQVRITLNASTPYGPQQAATVVVDTRVSVAFALAIRPI